MEKRSSRRIGLQVISEDEKEKEWEEKEDSSPSKKCWCRKCLKFKPPLKFSSSYDKYLDANGYLSICNDCIDEMYKKIFITEGTMERTILRLCRMLNVVYKPEGIETMKKEFASKQLDASEQNYIFGSYKKTLVRFHTGHTWVKAEGEEYLFVEPSVKEKSNISDDGFEDQEYFEESWGVGMTIDDYRYLEQEFTKWKKTNKCDTQSEEILIREICHKQNEIRKARVEGKTVDSLVKSLQEIMKNSALTPALQNAATAGKNMETFGVWVKEIESMEPAEWLEGEGHEMYRDVADVEGYFQKYFVRPLRNLMTQSKDFNVEDSDFENYDDADDIIDGDENG